MVVDISDERDLEIGVLRQGCSGSYRCTKSHSYERFHLVHYRLSVLARIASDAILRKNIEARH